MQRARIDASLERARRRARRQVRKSPGCESYDEGKRERVVTAWKKVTRCGRKRQTIGKGERRE